MLLIGRRLVQAIPVLFGTVMLTFVIASVLPGNITGSILGENASPEAVVQLEQRLGLNQPVLARFWDYFTSLLRGDFGQSLRTDESVLPMVLDRLWISVQLMVFGQVFALALAIAFASLSIRKPGGFVERFTSVLASAAISIPTFLFGIVLILVFAVHWKIFPAVGFTPLTDDVGKYFRSMVLPTVTLGFVEFAVYFRVLQSETHQIMAEDYVTTARAKGLSKGRIGRSHILRNSLFPLITVVGLNVGRLLGGSVIVESIFAIPGMGRLMVDAIGARDLPVVQGVVLFVALGYVVANLAVDLLYAVIDPRLRHGS
ncbi:MAG: ABC transporter permease [Ilumatobacteraceae bacterium]